MIRPILRILGELYYLEQSKPAISLHRLDSARLAELDKNLPLQWINGAALLEMGKNCSLSTASKSSPRQKH